MNVKEAQVSAFANPEIFALPMEEREAIFSDPIFADYTYAVQRYMDPKSQPLGYPYKAFERMEYVEMPYQDVTMPDGTVRKLTDEEYDDILYQYATSISYAASITQGILGGRENAVEDYLSFLKAGRSADPQTLLSIAGVDPLKEETYRAAMDYFKGLVDEYERLVDAKLQK